jgi:transposase
MRYSSDLTDTEWEIIQPLLPTRRKTRPPIWTKREILNGIFYQLKNGCLDSLFASGNPTGANRCNWSDLPRDLPPSSTVFWHYQQWCNEGAMERMMTALHQQARTQVKKNRSGRP